MKKFIAYISILVATSSMLSCANFDEMNENPYAIYETTAETFVQPILYNAEYTLVNANKSLISPLMQNTVSTNYETSAQLVYTMLFPRRHCRHLGQSMPSSETHNICSRWHARSRTLQLQVLHSCCVHSSVRY